MSGSRRTFLGIATLRGLKAVIALFTITLSSKYFGTSLDRDSWLLSIALIPTLSGMFFGPITEIFRAKFIMIKSQEGKDYALKTSISLIYTISLISLILITIIELNSKNISRIIAPGYTGHQIELVSLMIQIMAPTLLIQILINYWTGLLNCYNIFYIPEYYGIFSGFLNVIIIILLAPKIGIFSLVISNYLGNSILLIVLLIVLYKNKITVLKKVPVKFSLIKPYILYALPFYLNYFVAQITKLFEKALTTNLGQGNISVLDYARRFTDLPSGILQNSIGTIVTPILTQHYAKNDYKNYLSEFLKMIRFLLFVTLPPFSVIFICSEELVELLLHRGAFETQFVSPTALTLKWFSLGIIGVIIFSTSNQALVAFNKGKLVAITNVCLGAITLLVNLFFYKKIGVMFFAISYSTGLFIAGIFLAYFVVQKNLKIFLSQIFSLIPIYAFILLSSYFLRKFCISFFDVENNIIRLIMILVIFAFSSIVLITFIYILKIEERKLLNQFFKLKINFWKK